MDKKLFINELTEKFNKINIRINDRQCDKFYNYMNLLLEWNEKVNLTAITIPEEIILKHFIDSITINKYIKENDTILDIGTGAGFPGIPLKIVNESNNVVLVDSLNKRLKFLEEICNKLQLEKIELIHSRAEDLGQNNSYREVFEIVTSRAVAKLNTLIEYMLPFVKIGGKCICMKGQNVAEEIQEAKNAITILGGEIERVDKIILPNSDIERNIIIIKKLINTPAQYPRKAGSPTKEPII